MSAKLYIIAGIPERELCYIAGNVVPFRAGIDSYQPIPSERVTAFWHAYWRLCLEEAPQLQMKEPGPKPAQSDFIEFPLPIKPKGEEIFLYHKFKLGKVDLQFSNMAGDLAGLKAWFGPYLERGMTVDSAKKSGVIRVSVPPMEVQEPFDGQLDKARLGMQAALQLRHLYEGVVGKNTSIL